MLKRSRCTLPPHRCHVRECNLIHDRNWIDTVVNLLNNSTQAGLSFGNLRASAPHAMYTQPCVCSLPILVQPFAHEMVHWGGFYAEESSMAALRRGQRDKSHSKLAPSSFLPGGGTATFDGSKHDENVSSSPIPCVIERTSAADTAKYTNRYGDMFFNVSELCNVPSHTTFTGRLENRSQVHGGPKILGLEGPLKLATFFVFSRKMVDSGVSAKRPSLGVAAIGWDQQLDLLTFMQCKYFKTLRLIGTSAKAAKWQRVASLLPRHCLFRPPHLWTPPLPCNREKHLYTTTRRSPSSSVLPSISRKRLPPLTRTQEMVPSLQ